MYSICSGIKIEAIATGVPCNWRTLEEDFSKEGSNIDEKKLKRFIKLSGVKGRFVAGNHQTNSDWCYAAAEEILKKKSIDRNKIGVLVYVTQTADYQEPATALILQHRLQIGTDCIAFDINLGCSGFVFGLNAVASIMDHSDAEYGLLMCGEICSKKLSQKNNYDNLDDLLFGDAGSATLLVKDKKAKDLHFLSKSNGDGFKSIVHPWGFYRNPVLEKREIGLMDGAEVYRFSTNEVPELIHELMKKLNTTPDDYNYLGLHQANMLIINQIADTLGFPTEKNLISISDYGNTSSASIPTALVHNLGGLDKGEVRLLLSGYGIGLSWSVVDCYVDTRNIFELVKTDDYFVDGFGVD